MPWPPSRGKYFPPGGLLIQAAGGATRESSYGWPLMVGLAHFGGEDHQPDDRGVVRRPMFSARQDSNLRPDRMSGRTRSLILLHFRWRLSLFNASSEMLLARNWCCPCRTFAGPWVPHEDERAHRT